MISRIKGVVNALTDPPRLHIETEGGITYEVQVNQSMLTDESQKAFAAHGIWVWQVFGEDHQTLYGFYGHQDRHLAMRIREVQGMGPVSSAKLVQAAGYSRCLAAIVAKDAKALAALCSGLGPKRAQSIITDLQSYAAIYAADILPSSPAGNLAARFARLEAALLALGVGVRATLLREVLDANQASEDAMIIRFYLARIE